MPSLPSPLHPLTNRYGVKNLFADKSFLINMKFALYEQAALVSCFERIGNALLSIEIIISST